MKSCVSTTVMQTHPISSSPWACPQVWSLACRPPWCKHTRFPPVLWPALKCEVLCVDHRYANTADSLLCSGLPSSVKSCVSTTVMQTHPIPSCNLACPQVWSLVCRPQWCKHTRFPPVLGVDHRDTNTPDSFLSSACQSIAPQHEFPSFISLQFKPKTFNIADILIKTLIHWMSVQKERDINRIQIS